MECGRAAPDPEPCPVLKEELEAIEEGVTEQEEEEVAPLPLKDVVPDEVTNELVRAEPVHKEDLEGIAELEVPLKLPVQEVEDEAPRSIETLPGMPVRPLV